jgi:hypothetical protein
VNGAATVSPLLQANFCICGHDLAVHVLATFPTIGTCGLCGHTHDFVSANELYPRAEFSASLPPRTISPAVYPAASGAGFTNSTSSGPNVKGIANVIFQNIKNGVVPGMCFMTMPTNLAQQTTYRILAINYASKIVTIPQPGLLFGTNNTTCLWLGADGSSFGGGQPPNGQRAG